VFRSNVVFPLIAAVSLLFQVPGLPPRLETPAGEAQAGSGPPVEQAGTGREIMGARAVTAGTLAMQGAVNWQLSGNSVRLQVAGVANTRTTTSSPLYLTLLATPQPVRFGADLSTSFLLARYSLGTLGSGFYFANVDSGFIPYNRPAAGTYSITMTLDENVGGSYFYYDLVSFTNTQTFGAACTQDATTLCLLGGRFSVRANWSVPSQGTSGAGNVLPLPGGDTGYFWFFSPNAAELMVKAIDGRAVNGRFWIFYGALSDVVYTISVTDTFTGAARNYTNPSGNLASVADVSAFIGGGASPTATATPIPTPTPTPPPGGSLAGAWSGTISSADPSCVAFGAQSISGSFTQVSQNFAGTFGISGGTTGFFQGAIVGNSVSGVETATFGGCTGSGSFSGTLSGNRLTISVPLVTTLQLGCQFCQQNTVVLNR
jgi:hypothetical protein